MSGMDTPGVTFGCVRPPLGVAEGPVRELLARSVARDPDESLPALMNEIERGDVQLWVAHDGPELLAACITQVLKTASGRQCFIRHCAGKAMTDGIRFLPIIEEWAKSERCKSMKLVGRSGWARALPGFRQVAVVLGKDL